jgi:Pretoxin HINT domain
LTPEGSKPIEQFREGDLILSRDQDDPTAPVTVRRVVDTFTRIAPILNLHVGGRIIETTREHPFYVDGKGWRTAHELRIGDVLLSHDGLRVAVEGLAESGRVETVYNLEVEDYHTYFVGSPEWSFDVWAHNYKGAKRGPKPKGEGPHNQTIERRIQELNKKLGPDWQHVGGGSLTEKVIPIPKGGYKSARRPDITFENKKTGQFYHEQVGRTTKAAGAAVRREQQALDDLEKATGVRPHFTPYDR